MIGIVQAELFGASPPPPQVSAPMTEPITPPEPAERVWWSAERLWRLADIAKANGDQTNYMLIVSGTVGCTRYDEVPVSPAAAAMLEQLEAQQA